MIDQDLNIAVTKEKYEAKYSDELNILFPGETILILRKDFSMEHNEWILGIKINNRNNKEIGWLPLRALQSISKLQRSTTKNIQRQSSFCSIKKSISVVSLVK